MALTRMALMIVVCVTLASAQAQVIEPLSNAGFEDGLDGWAFWPTDSGSKMVADTEVRYAGNASLRIDAVSPSDRAFVLTSADQFERGMVYRLSVAIRNAPGVPDSSVGFIVNYRKLDGGAIVAKASPADLTRTRDGEWTVWSGLFLCPHADVSWQILLRVEDAVGSVWFDDLRFENLGDAGELTPDMWTYMPMGVEIEGAPASRFRAHRDAEDDAYKMARRYNALMMRSALAEARMREAERTLTYAGSEPAPRLRQLFEAAEQALNACYLSFAAAFRSAEDADVKVFGDSAARAEGALGDLEAATGIAGSAPSRMPEKLGWQSRDIPPFDATMRMNRLLIGAWSPGAWEEFERPFDFEFHSGPNTGIAREYDGVTADFTNITEACDGLVAEGYAGTFSMLPFGQHDVIWAPKSFIEAHADDDDIWKTSWDGARGRSRGSYYGLNYYHPAVREHIATYLQKIATFIKDEPRVFFYEFAQEAYPYFGCDKGRRETGYGPSATAAFHAWLRDEYRDIATLNREWGSGYGDFAAIAQPPDRFAQPDREITPLVAEFERFREDGYIEYLKLVYDSVKAGDTTKPVASRHSSLLMSINGARIFETCDILGYHSRAPRMQVMNLYLNTLARVNNKPLAYLEDFWGCQQESRRIGDERAQRRGMEKHVSRAFAWGRTLQMKWYAYTTGSYLLSYNGNWFNPRYDVLTMRYCAPALKVALDRMRDFDWVLTHSRIPAFRVCVWQPSASMRTQVRGGLSAGEIVNLHGMIYPAGLMYELVPEEYFADGREELSDYDVVILPCAEYLSEDHQRRLAEWVKAGGTLLAIEPPGVRDELTRPSGALLREVFGVGEASFDAEAAEWSFEVPGGEMFAGSDMVVVDCGEGRAMMTPSLLARTLLPGDARAALLAELLARTERLVWSERARFEVFMRVTEEGDRYLFVLNPDPDLPATDLVRVDQAVDRAVDVSVNGGYPVPVVQEDGRATMNIKLGACEMAVIWLDRE